MGHVADDVSRSRLNNRSGEGLCQAERVEGGEREGEGRLDQPFKVIQPYLKKKLKEPPVSKSSIPGH